MPEISVVMGVYRRKVNRTLLERSIRSILEQTFSDFEFLICDDGSCEEVCSILESFALSDSRIRLVRTGKEFSFHAEKLNNCLKLAEGRYIARQDDDDFSFSDRFEKQLSFLTRNLAYSYVGCNVNLVREDKVVGYRKLPERPQIGDFMFVQPYIHPALVIRKELLISVGGYSEDIRCRNCEDYDLLMRMMGKGMYGYNLQEILFDYSIPPIENGQKEYRYRVDEAIVRWRGFKANRMLPRALPYVVKPLIVGIIPAVLLNRMKENRVYEH